MRSRKIHAYTVLVLCIGVSLVVVQPGAFGSTQTQRPGGIVRVALRGADVDSLDPAISYEVASGLLLGPTCASLLSYGDGPHGTSALRPEVASGFPRSSDDGRTLTFTLRDGFRFSDGTPVRATAFVRAINRMLSPEMKSPWAFYLGDIVGAEHVLAGKATAAAGVVGKGRTLVIRLERPIPDFPARTSFLCAVPPALPADREGVAVIPAAGPYYIAEYRPAERIVIRRNRFYGGSRPQRVEGFDVDLRVGSQEEVLDRIERGDADWGWALSSVYLDPARRLAAKYGVNRSRFFLRPGTTFRGYAFNTSRPLFRNNPQLRRAVNFAIDRAAFRRASGGLFSSGSRTSTCHRAWRASEMPVSTLSKLPTSAAHERLPVDIRGVGRSCSTRSTCLTICRSHRGSSRTSRRSGWTCESRRSR